MTANKKLLVILLEALNEFQCSEFEYIWEWEVSLLPERFLIINGQNICDRIGFDFSELDLDELAAAGYFDKMVERNTDTEVIIRYQLKA